MKDHYTQNTMEQIFGSQSADDYDDFPIMQRA